MPNVRPPLPKIPTPPLVIVFSAAAVSAVAAFFVWFWAPPPERVFWRTVDNNLSSRSVSLETQAWLGLADRADVFLLGNRLDIDFEAGGAYFQQKTLFYDRSLPESYASPLQLAQYEQAGLETPPTQEWYEQECYLVPDGAWARHDLYARPARDDWRRLFSDGSENPAWGDDWQKFGLEENNFLSWHHFLMISATSGGFFYGNLDADDRQELLSLLRRAYKVDFGRTRTFRRSGRPFYEYRVGFDQAALGRAFVYYFNAQAEAVGLEERISLSPEQAANIFQTGEATHTVVVDAWAGRIAEIEHPLRIGPGWLAQGLSPDFIVAPLISPVVGNAPADSGSALAVKTRVAGQNQRLDLEAPPGEGGAAR